MCNMQSELKDRLKQSRKEKRLTQTEVANAVGITQATYSELERGLVKSSGKIVELANLFNVNPNWLATGEGEMIIKSDIQSITSNSSEVGTSFVNTSVVDLIDTLKDMEKTGELTPQLVGLLNNTIQVIKSLSNPKDDKYTKQTNINTQTLYTHG